MGDSDLLLKPEVLLLIALWDDGGIGMVDAETPPAALLDGVLTSNELGIDRVTGRSVERTDVVEGGGVNVVSWSVDISGVE